MLFRSPEKLHAGGKNRTDLDLIDMQAPITNDGCRNGKLQGAVSLSLEALACTGREAPNPFPKEVIPEA